MLPAPPTPEYESQLRELLSRQDWQALREFSRTHNQIPEDVYAQGQHFWEVLMHKLICSRIDLLGQHEASRAWLTANGYTMDIGGY
jgi:hypothetical protein